MHYRKWKRIPFGIRDTKREVIYYEDGSHTIVYSANLWPSWIIPY